MKILKPNPAKGWKLVRELQESGEYIYHTGYSAYNILSTVQGDIRVTYDFMGEKDENGRWKRIEIPIEHVDNFVFYARLKYTGCKRGRSAAIFSFDDADGINTFETGMAGMDELLKSVADYSVSVVDGLFIGTFTFKKQGSEIYFRPT